MSKDITTIIVDNEISARDELRKLLESYEDINVVEEAENINEGIEKIQLLQPDFLFINIQLPELELLHQVNLHQQIIYISSSCEHAIRAFELNALDYLLKPFQPQRIFDALQKIRNEFSRNLLSAATQQKNILTEDDTVFIKDGEHCWFIRLHEVRLFESIGNYARVLFGDNKPLILKSLNALEERLDNRIFFRANRKYIINLKWIDKIEPYFNGGLLIGTKCGEKIEVSRRQALKLKEAKSF